MYVWLACRELRRIVTSRSESPPRGDVATGENNGVEALRFEVSWHFGSQRGELTGSLTSGRRRHRDKSQPVQHNSKPGFRPGLLIWQSALTR